MVARLSKRIEKKILTGAGDPLAGAGRLNADASASIRP
jgi:hypothetical protein